MIFSIFHFKQDKILTMNIRNSWTLIQFLRLFLVSMLTEILFRWIAFGVVLDARLAVILLFTAGSCLFLAVAASFLPVKAGNRLIGFLIWFLAVYGVVQLQFKNFMNVYMSVKASYDGAGRIGQYVWGFLITIQPKYLLLLAAPIIIRFVPFLKIPADTDRRKNALMLMSAAVLMDLFAYSGVGAIGTTRLYRNPDVIDRALQNFGLGRYFLLDVLSIGGTPEETLIMAPTADASADTAAASASPEEAEAEMSSRAERIDDTAWQKAAAEETDDSIRKIDQFLMSRSISDYNDHTGMFKDMNVIYMMVEAFDYMAIDPQLTPTLYRMKEEGWDFTSHYTPIYSCATGESELASEVSLIPQSDVCTPNTYTDNDWNDSIFSLFDNAGYYTSAYHNWKDEYYERRTLYSHSGCQAYLNYDDLNYQTIQGWQSDREMMELTLPYYIDQDRFFTLYVTSSTHFPYDEDSELGDRYLDEINKVYPDYPIAVKRYISKAMELDKAMEYLLEHLKEAGKLDNTLIVMFADHHPLKTELSVFEQYGSAYCARTGIDVNRTPLIFYNSTMTASDMDEINSTMDILPTVANLLGLDFDPRLYAGTDYFSDEKKLVSFPDGEWISEEGQYDAAADRFSGDLSSDQVSSINIELQNLYTVSKMIYLSNYFHYRSFLTDPAGSGMPG